MGLVEKVKNMGSQIEQGASQTFLATTKLFIIIISGFFIGLTFGYIGQVLFEYGTFGLSFITLLTLGLIYKFLSRWSITQILIFNLIVVLIGTLLRMYILVAP